MRIGTHLLLAGITLATLAPPAHAAESVLLANGFEMRCDHHAQIGKRVRLYLSAGGDSYIELHPEEIASVTHVPDPPPQQQPPAAREAATEARLTPADLRQMLSRAGQAHNIDVDLLASIVKAESNGNTRAVSRAGARGLMQLMPSTATGLGVQDSFQPDQNLRGGSAYLDELLTRYHENLALALAAYNAGPAAVDRYHGIPPYRETRIYVARVIHEFNRRVLAREAQARRAAAQSSAGAAISPASPAGNL